MPKASAFLPERFETVEEAKVRRDYLAGALRRADTTRATRLAERLAACEKGARCTSGACPICVRLRRKNFLSQIEELLEPEPVLLRASIIPRNARVATGELLRFDLATFVRSKQRALQRCLPKDVIAVGGVDISANVDGGADAYWQVHLYLLAGCRNSEATRTAFRQRFPGDPEAPRPYAFKEVSPEDFAEVVSYGWKREFYTRSRYTDLDGRSRTRSLPLKPELAVEAALFDHKHDLSGRYVFKGIKRHATRSSWRLVRVGG